MKAVNNVLAVEPQVNQYSAIRVAKHDQTLADERNDMAMDSTGMKPLEYFTRQPIIPVVWDPTTHAEILGHASAIFLQGGPLEELAGVLEKFRTPNLDEVALFVHIDLVSGLENNDAGLKYLSSFDRIVGVVSVHHHLATAARRLGLLSIVRLFLSDSRAVERGLSVVAKSRPDMIEILPAAVAPKVEVDFRNCQVPRITGGLCRTPEDVDDVLRTGCRAVTSTRPELWRLNKQLNPLHQAGAASDICSG